MEKEKKKWETPKLICLYRGRPEEAVLVVCKAGGNSLGPYDICRTHTDNCYVTGGAT